MAILRDPRAMRKDEELGTVVYLFSLPDTAEVKAWAPASRFVTKMWDNKRLRLKVYGRFVLQALKVPEATPAQLTTWKELAYPDRFGRIAQK